MNVKKCLGFLMVLTMAAVPVTALADELTYDDNTFETTTALSREVAPAVQFDAPDTGTYALDSVSFHLEAAEPGIYPVVVQIWDDALATVDTISWDVDFTGNAAYTLDLTAAKLSFKNSIRVGIFERDDALVPVPGPMSLGADSVSLLPFGNSYGYDSTIIPPLDPWSPEAEANLGIRASVHLVPALTCKGFLPPFNRTVRMRWGGRTIPLKSFLVDDAGAPVTPGALTAPPSVRLLYASEEGVEPIDMSSLVAPAGGSGTGKSFRGTSGNMWIYNLKTPRNLPPGTYTVLMDSGDGMDYVVDPACTGTFVIGGRTR